MSAGIVENTNSGPVVDPTSADSQNTENTKSISQDKGVDIPERSHLDDLCAATLKRRGRRGRPKGSGRKQPDDCQPKTFRHFSPLAHSLLSSIRLTGPEFMEQTEAEIVEEALVRYARALSNRNPALARRLERVGR